MSLDLQAILIHLSKFGRPRISLMPGGWYCSMELFVPGEGITCKITSEMEHKTPLAAAGEALHRLTNFLNETHQKADTIQTLSTSME